MSQKEGEFHTRIKQILPKRQGLKGHPIVQMEFEREILKVVEEAQKDIPIFKLPTAYKQIADYNERIEAREHQMHKAYIKYKNEAEKFFVRWFGGDETE